MPRTDAILSVEDVTKSFGPVKAVRGVTLTITRGESVSIIGPNGAGKSTFFGLVAGEHRPTSGTISYEGSNVTSMSAAGRARRGMSRTFQVARFFSSRTVRDNLVLSRIAAHGHPMRPWNRYQSSVDDTRIDRALAELSLDTLADVRADYLPQGDRKRLEFAMALVQDPKVLLLDEPTAGMSLEDTARTIRTLAAIRQEREGMTIVLTAHDMDVVFALSDRVVLMGQGQVVIEGTPAEVERAPETRELYLGSVDE